MWENEGGKLWEKGEREGERGRGRGPGKPHLISSEVQCLRPVLLCFVVST